MKNKISGIAKAVVFLFLLGIILLGANMVLMPKTYIGNSPWPTTSTYNQFYDMKKDTIDVLFIGSSVVENAFSPQEIYDSYGIRSFNLSSQQQSIFYNYYWLKEALKYQNPKVVVLDSRFLFKLHPENSLNTLEGISREIVDNMKWSSNKVDMINQICELDPNVQKASFYLTNLRYHARWTDLDESDFNFKLSAKDELKGQAISTERTDDTYIPFVSSDSEVKSEMDEIMVEYFAKIVDLCDENDIELVLITLPDQMMYDGMNNSLEDLASEYDVDYYNLCKLDYITEIDANAPEENIYGHENIWGARKMSRYMGKLLSETYKVPSFKDAQWESTKDYYDHIMASSSLQYTEDFDEYLDLLKDDDEFVTFITVRGDAFTNLTNKDKKKLKALGLETSFEDMTDDSYSAIVDNINGNLEKTDKEAVVSLAGNIKDQKVIYSIASGENIYGTACGIFVAGESYCVNGYGWNIVVYDRIYNKVVDSVCFTPTDEGNTCLHLNEID